jgi:hypothetical protein
MEVFSMRLKVLLPVVALVLAGAALSACTGTAGFPEVSDVEIDGSGEMEFTGVVDSIGPDAWSVGGLTVGITVATEIAGDPQVGDMVKVHALVVAPESLVAREIAPAETGPDKALDTAVPPAPGEEIEFVGPVVNIDLNRWTVGDQVVAITSDTEIKGTIAVGDLVKVHALVEPDLSLTAREIEPASEEDALGEDDSADDNEEDLEFKGLVEAIAGQDWTVAGTHFLVPATAQIEGVIAVGDLVEIHAFWSPQGVLTAIRVQLEDKDGEDSSSDDDSEDDSSDEDEDESDDDHGGDQDDDSDDDDGDNSGSGSS